MHISKNVTIKSCHIFKKNKNGHFIFGFFWIRSVQNGSNSQIRWTDISNSRIQVRRAWFLVRSNFRVLGIYNFGYCQQLHFSLQFKSYVYQLCLVATHWCAELQLLYLAQCNITVGDLYRPTPLYVTNFHLCFQVLCIY